MKLYTASASCDWGTIYSNEQVKGTKWNVAFNRAAYLAQQRARRRPRQISITLRLVGTVKKEKAVSIDPANGFPSDYFFSKK
jgi:hypothetical protein